MRYKITPNFLIKINAIDSQIFTSGLDKKFSKEKLGTCLTKMSSIL